MAGANSWLSLVHKLLKDRQQMKRAEQLFERMPDTSQVYSPEAMVRALRKTSPGNLVGMTPTEFRAMSAGSDLELDPALIQTYAKMMQDGEPFDRLPFLSILDDLEFAQILGHDGRQRMRGAGQVFGSDAEMPVQLHRFIEGNNRAVPGRINSPTLSSEMDEDEFIEMLGRPRFKKGGLNQYCSCGGHKK